MRDGRIFYQPGKWHSHAQLFADLHEKLGINPEDVVEGGNITARGYKATFSEASSDPHEQFRINRTRTENVATAPKVRKATSKLPQQLAGAKPRYGYGTKLFTLDFESDLDKALYTIANSAKRSKADAAYLQWAMKQNPGATEKDLRAAGDRVRAAIKVQAESTPAGNLQIPNTRSIEALAKPPSPPSPLGQQLHLPARQMGRRGNLL